MAERAPRERTSAADGLRVGAAIELDIFELSDRGDGVGRLGDRDVHVAGAFPGERVRATLTHLARQTPRAFAKLRATLRPHLGRRPPPCASHQARRRGGGGCDGCPTMGLDVASQRALRVEELSALGLPIDTIVGAEPAEPGSRGYRWSSKRVAFADGDGRLRLGSFARGSARGQTMAGCLVDHPAIEAAFAAIEATARRANLGADDLRWVWAKTDGDAVVVTLITADAESAAARLLPERVGGVRGWAQAVHGGEGNAIRSEALRHLRGDGALTLRFDIGDAPVQVEVGPLAFLQPNPRVAAMAWRDLLTEPDSGACRGALALDLYAGAGVTTAALRGRFERVVAIEAWPESAAALGVAAADVGEALAAWAHGRALAGHAPLDTAPDLVVANPPRAGIGAAACAALCAIGPARVHIMSCNPRSLARDLDALAASYELVAARAYDTLPHTQHVEVVAWLRRRTEAA